MLYFNLNTILCPLKQIPHHSWFLKQTKKKSLKTFLLFKPTITITQIICESKTIYNRKRKNYREREKCRYYFSSTTLYFPFPPIIFNLFPSSPCQCYMVGVYASILYALYVFWLWMCVVENEGWHFNCLLYGQKCYGMLYVSHNTAFSPKCIVLFLLFWVLSNGIVCKVKCSSAFIRGVRCTLEAEALERVKVCMYI